MSNNIVDLSNLETKDLLRELNNRGYNTYLLFGRGDVDDKLSDVNDQLVSDGQPIIELTDSDKDDILSYCVENQSFEEMIVERIKEQIYDYEEL